MSVNYFSKRGSSSSNDFTSNWRLGSDAIHRYDPIARLWFESCLDATALHVR